MMEKETAQCGTESVEMALFLMEHLEKVMSNTKKSIYAKPDESLTH